jgi:hypothetical protein
MNRQRAITGWVAAFVCVLWIAACGDGGTPPPVASDVMVSPATIYVTEGEQAQAQATVLDGNGSAIHDVTVTWSSDDETVATVDQGGMVTGQAAGTTVIRAAYNGIQGTADVTVDGTAEFSVSQRSVTVHGYVGSTHAPLVVDIEGPEPDSITGLTVQLTYDSEVVDWITVDLDDTSVPATLTLEVSTDGLPAGEYAGSVVIASDTPEEGEREIDVRLTIAGLAIVQTGGGTSVSETGTTDSISVALELQPATNVVLSVTSSDPEEVTVSPDTLTFTNQNWSTPQWVVVTGVDDDSPDGTQLSVITIAVDTARSDPRYDPLPPRTVNVTTVDDDGGDDAGSGVSEGAPAGHPGVSTDQLVASYDMSTLTPEGLLRDFSGNDLHGTLVGTTPVDGERGGARYFPGTVTGGLVDDYIELPSDPLFDLDGPFSVAAWFSFYRQFQHQHIVACNDKFTLWITEQDHLRFANSRGDYAEMTVRVSPNEFHSVSAVFRGTVGDVIDDSTVEIWLDGVRQLPLEYGSPANDPPIWRDGVLHPTDACHIGFESHQGRPDHQILPYYGYIDEVIVFGRALTPGEIALLAVTPD